MLVSLSLFASASPFSGESTEGASVGAAEGSGVQIGGGSDITAILCEIKRIEQYPGKLISGQGVLRPVTAVFVALQYLVFNAPRDTWG